MLELRAKERAEATILDHIIGIYLADFVKNVAQETLKAGLLAKRRAEDEVNGCCSPLQASLGTVFFRLRVATVKRTYSLLFFNSE